MSPAEYHKECLATFGSVEGSKAAEEARSKMWASLIPGYLDATRNQKKKMKTEYLKMFAKPNRIEEMFITLDCCTAQSKPCEPKAAPRKGNDNMYVEQNMTVTEKTTEDTRRQYFLNELSGTFAKKDEELREKFGLSVPKSPKTPKELVEWIKAGEYTFIKGYDPEGDDDDDGWDCWTSPIHGFRWTKVKKDRKGYDTAYAALRSSRDSFRNEIWAEIDPANFIKILAKFEKATIH